MPNRLRAALVAECVGSFFLTFIGILAIYQMRGAGDIGLLGVAIAHGLALALGVTATMAASGGHLNPAVTIGFLVTGKMKAGEVISYIAAQLVGGTSAAFWAYLAVGGGELGARVVHNGAPAVGEIRSGA